MLSSTSASTEAGLLFGDDVLSLRSQSIQNDLEHDFTCMTDQADGTVVLTEL